MKEKEILELINQHEWKNIECKEARDNVPKSAYETVSAFANTEGGHLIFGVKKDDANFEITGVNNIDQVQNDFISTLRSTEKISQIFGVKEYKYRIDGKDILIFYIPEASRYEKPVHLNRTIARSYLRVGACDVKCNANELGRLLRDASSIAYDSEAIDDFESDNFYDEKTLRWYRNAFSQQRSGRHETMSDEEFLLEWNFLKEEVHSKKPKPTRAAILILGKARYVRQILSRPIVDYQRIKAKSYEVADTEKRWDDRQVFEENLIQTWLGLSDKYISLNEIPFSIDKATMRRDDTPSDYIAFREATINLLMHQDYGNHGRIPIMHFFQDRIIFKNPGSAFASEEELLRAGDKEVRNPLIVSMFRRIGLSEQAGTGIPSIYRNWEKFTKISPEVKNDKAKNTFEVIFFKERAYKDIIPKTALHKQHVKQRETLFFCIDPKSMAEIQKELKFGSRTYFKRTILNPLIDKGALRLTKPEKPKARDQKYHATEQGLQILKQWKEKK